MATTDEDKIEYFGNLDWTKINNDMIIKIKFSDFDRRLAVHYDKGYNTAIDDAMNLDIRKIITDWYYKDLDPAVTISEISQIRLTKRIVDELEQLKKEKRDDN